MTPGREFQCAGTSSPRARVWGVDAATAAAKYAKTFRLTPGANIIVRALGETEGAELFGMGAHGLRRLHPGGVR